MPPETLTLNVAFKNTSLKHIGEFGSFEHELPVLLAWCLAVNTVLSFMTTGVSILVLLCRVGEQTQVW